MNRKKLNPFDFNTPKIIPMLENKSKLRRALLVSHQNRSSVKAFFRLTHNMINNMSKVKKGFSFSVLTVLAIVFVAGIMGTSASDIVHAEAKEAVQRSLTKMVKMEKQDRLLLEQKFQERIQLKGENGFSALKEFSEEEIADIKASLADVLVEAQSASDLRVISADEMPRRGVIAKTGRGFGFDMMKGYKNFEDKLENLPEDICEHFKTHKSLYEELIPSSILVYTDLDGNVVHLGINSQDEAVVKFVNPTGFGEFKQNRRFQKQ